VLSIDYEQSGLGDLQASLDAYLDKHLEFAELRTQWITTLAENPQMRTNAVRLLYQQPPDRHLPEERAIALKRIVETAIHEGPDDWTITLDEDESDDSPSVEISLGDTLSPGHVLKDRFVLEKLLGRGGIGVVYKARDRLAERADTGTDKVAVKLLREELRSKPELLDALQREALQARKLSHPNIARVHDLHRDGETCFLTMELLEGELLRSMMSRLEPKTLSRDRAIKIILGMCGGLAHAHANGLVHADFKPGNVFLTAKDVPKIFDFGFAQIAPSLRHKEPSPEQTSKPLHAITPAYSSCNRLEGGSPVFSDDVYSLSCVIYELLAGRHPYDKKSALVVRELNLQPDRVAGLTDLQWRTLMMGLKPSRQDRNTEVHDLQEAFTRRPPVQPAPSAKAKSGGLKPMRYAIIGILLGAGLVLGTTQLDPSLIPSSLIDLVRPQEPVPVTSTPVDTRAGESSTLQPIVVPEETLDPEPDLAMPQTTVSESPLGGAAVPEATLTGALESESTLTETVVREPVLSESVPVPSESVLPDAEVTLTLSTDSDAIIAAPAAILNGFRLDSAEYVVREDAAALTVQISRQGDLSSPANVEWTTFAGSADPQSDYASYFRRAVRFSAGEESKSIFIPIVSDNTAEAAENFRIALSRPGNDMVLAEPFTATVTIVDDDF